MGLLSAEELRGYEVFGDRSRVVRGERVVEPAVGARIIRSLLRVGKAANEEKVSRVLGSIGLSKETAGVFLSRREIVTLPPEVGGGLEARPVIPGLEFDSLSNYTGSEQAYEIGVQFGSPKIIDASEKKYTLNNVFRDTTLADKLRISARRLQSAKRLAVSDPTGAATALSDYIQEHGFPNARVSAGDYAKTVNNAIDFIHAMGDSIVYADSAAPAVVSSTHLEVSYDQFHLKDVIWTVRGPLKYATEINIVYQLAIHYGPEYVMFMLGSETLRLDIDIRNEKTGVYYTGKMQGFSSLSGIVPAGYGFPPELTADQHARLLIASKKISPVYVGDKVIGSAVHVSDKHVILNEHTLAITAQSGVTAELCGLPIDDSMSVSGDVCVVRRDGGHAQWHFREPEVGERVVLCYSVGASVEYSEVLQVVGCAEQLICTGSNILRKGASGAAVIALRDSAMLGIFSTMRASRVFCALFSSSSFATVSDCQSVASASQYAATPGVDAGDRTYAKMVRRGFLGFLEHIERSVTSLYVDAEGRRKMVGLMANVGGDWHTTVDPDVAQLSMADGRLLAFRSSVSGTYVVEGPPPILQAVPNARTVQPGERVFVFTKADDDVIMSSVRIVTHCMADNKGFIVEDFGESEEEMTGGLIVAERDAAVLGMYARRACDSFGKFSIHCAVFNHSVASVRDYDLDVRSVRAEMTDLVLPFDSVFAHYTKFGHSVWVVAAGHGAHSDGRALSDVLPSVLDLWSEKCRVVVSSLGWSLSEIGVLERYGLEDASFAFLGLVYLRDSDYVSDKLRVILSDKSTEFTPVVGDFPFPRASSVDSTTMVGRVRAGTPESQRLQELEQKMTRLTEMMSKQERRLSGVSSDNG